MVSFQNEIPILKSTIKNLQSPYPLSCTRSHLSGISLWLAFT